LAAISLFFGLTFMISSFEFGSLFTLSSRAGDNARAYRK
jgi:hypothetical protein